MQLAKYILLYLPIVLLSTIGIAYYGLDWACIEPNQSPVVVEAYNFALYLSFVAVFGLVWHNIKHPIQSIAFRVQLEHMLMMFIIPKAIDHYSMVKSTILSVEPILNPYVYNILPYILVGLYLLITPIRIFLIRRKKRYDGN